MALMRSGSARSTLSMMQRKATKYQKFLNLSNVFLLITSTILIFSAVILIKFYHINKLDFWSSYFWVAPILMIVLGVYTFLVCVYGFLISGSENRALLALYALLLSIAFITQLISIFTAMEVRTKVAQSNIGSVAVNDDLSKYGEDWSVSSKWDDLQADLHCCGGNNFLTGYNDYRNTPIGKNFSVPDSCCHNRVAGCGQGIFRFQEADIRNRIFLDGCLTILKDKLETDVIPMMIVYACIGVLLAIVELITVVLACAYVAQITRKIQREEKMWRHGSADRNGDDDVVDTLNHETMC
ncbi:hypothetical protein TCAL_12183 [Tigriopus californicus]|uniref:Tetraspanin n=1 Tax=Tigriopus californicus TaxID=6832 RepID=A0A553PMP1_TIGCA|nr:CD63 antigen-like [Tigriopus californicus]TRY78926.1 hypothetical protein TCAL_12183 [Tigriopus californicus]|eukprot:TCALIF_12183-PA protein Name:"Similar to CD63 CD63 antigen (Homo sapiens)" AED:0.04 eAED:0.04 QI:0/-1/0/1/-1/1/1/0/296